MNNPKIDQNIQNNLFSVNTGIVVTAIQKIKEKGNKEYLPLLFDVLLSSPETEIENSILELLETVKDKESVPYFIEAIINKKYKSIQKKILTTCWQNGLDFSDFAEVFVDIVIEEEWETAFEAFTIIDNFEYLPKQEIVLAINKKIDGIIESTSDEKKYFLQEILRVLR